MASDDQLTIILFHLASYSHVLDRYESTYVTNLCHQRVHQSSFFVPRKQCSSFNI